MVLDYGGTTVFTLATVNSTVVYTWDLKKKLLSLDIAATGIETLGGH